MRNSSYEHLTHLTCSRENPEKFKCLGADFVVDFFLCCHILLSKPGVSHCYSHSDILKCVFWGDAWDTMLHATIRNFHSVNVF